MYTEKGVYNNYKMQKRNCERFTIRKTEFRKRKDTQNDFENMKKV